MSHHRASENANFSITWFELIQILAVTIMKERGFEASRLRENGGLSPLPLFRHGRTSPESRPVKIIYESIVAFIAQQGIPVARPAKRLPTDSVTPTPIQHRSVKLLPAFLYFSRSGWPLSSARRRGWANRTYISPQPGHHSIHREEAIRRKNGLHSAHFTELAPRHRSLWCTRG